MSTAISQTLDFKMGDISHSTYRMTKLVPQVGSTTQIIGNSNSTVVFELPPSTAYNLARSSLEFTITPTAAGIHRYTNADASTADINMFNFLYEIPGIERLQLVTRSGQSLIDCVNFQEYMQVVAKTEKTLDTFNTSDSLDLIQRCGSDTKLATGALVGLSSNDFKQWFVGTSTAADPVLPRSLKLGDFKGMFASLDKSIYFPEVLELKITFAPYTSWGWRTLAADRPEGNLTTAATLRPPVALAGNITLSNLNMKLCQERDLGVITALQNKIMGGGLNILTPFIHSFRQTIDTAQQTVTVRLSAGHGTTVEKIYHSFFAGDQSVNNRVNNVNTLGVKIANHYTLLNDLRMNEYDYSPTDTWVAQRDYMRGYAIGQNATVFSQNFVIVQNFCGEFHDCAGMNKIGGLDLSQEQKWAIYATCGTTAAYNHLTFAQCSKTVSITASGVMVM